MGLFTNATRNNFNVVAEGAYEPNILGGLKIVAEAEENYNKIMKAVALEELAYLEEHGTDMVYTEAANSGFFAKVREFFMNLLAKIKAMFTKFFAMFDSYTKTDKEFLNKYQTKLRRLSLKDFEYSGYTFTHTGDANTNDVTFTEVEAGSAKYDLAGVKAMDQTALDAALKNLEDNKEDILDKIRAEKVPGSGGNSVSASEFASELFQYFRSGDNSKDSIDITDINKYLKVIENAAEYKKNAEKQYTKTEKAIKDLIKTLESAEKDLNTTMKNDKSGDTAADKANSSKLRTISEMISILKSKSSIETQFNSALLQAIKDENRQAKSICVAAIMKFKDPVKEGFTHYTNENAGFLQNVVLK
jgi:hypothetical protein